MTLIFVVTWLVLLFYAIRLMSQGWNTTETKPVIEEKQRKVTTYIFKSMHASGSNYLGWPHFLIIRL